MKLTELFKSNNAPLKTNNSQLSVGDEVILRDDTKKNPDVGQIIAGSLTTGNVYRVKWSDHVIIPHSLYKKYKKNSELVVPKNVAWHHVDQLRSYADYQAEVELKQKIEEDQKAQHQKIKKGLLNWLRN